ncbi:hypothetical protein mRhiFer1_009730 [Rhinolophus ferrumequinum]|uniref:Uncharacterized protein n=1 Tax=Rhinolophus ferrumequinum TaxID=59479 RepID=A0A7J7ZCT9_RHIFE|nr:hypothetical protein mRhiFer1_009730 [Rhinolophus ferrumequinum]
MALHKSLNLSELPFPLLSNEDNGAYFTRVLQRWREETNKRHLAQSVGSTNECWLSPFFWKTLQSASAPSTVRILKAGTVLEEKRKQCCVATSGLLLIHSVSSWIMAPELLVPVLQGYREVLPCALGS